jgi:hypothetical protein
VPFRVIRSRKGTDLPKPLWTVVETGAGQNRYDAWPRGALRIDEIEVASSRDFHQAACAEHLAHSKRHGVIVDAVDERDRNGRSGQRRGIGDGITFRNVVRSAAHQQEHRPGAEIPFRAQAQ